MRARLLGKFVVIAATLGLVIAAFIQAVTTTEFKQHRAKRAIAFSVLALVGATSIRYFED